jgi:BirA family biotin operon repressor/biotin-[acetyl-CoA-carboxylase] ligase
MSFSGCRPWPMPPAPSSGTKTGPAAASAPRVTSLTRNRSPRLHVPESPSASSVFDLARLASCGLVARIDYHDSLGSTSDRALELAAQGAAPLPLLVLAQRQTAGRGRGANRWWAAEGALTFSLIVEAPPDRLPPDRWPQVALAAGLAVCEALHAVLPAATLQVKWPNDVYLAGRKLCGILSESVPGWRDRLVVGIGINVNNSLCVGWAVPTAGSEGSGDRRQGTGVRGQESKLTAVATALIDHDGLPRDLTDVLLAVLDRFDHRFSQLLAASFEPLAGDYRCRCFLTGKTVTIEQPGGYSLVGLCRGIDDRGRLRLWTENGEHAVASGTVLRWE